MCVLISTSASTTSKMRPRDTVKQVTAAANFPLNEITVTVFLSHRPQQIQIRLWLEQKGFVLIYLVISTREIQHVKGQHSTTVQLHKIHPEALGLMINTDIEQLQWLMQPCVWMFYLFVEPQSIMPVLAGVMTEITQITSSSELHSRISECQDSHSFPLAVEWCYWCQRQRSCHGDGRHGGISRGRLMAKWSRASMTAKNQTGQVAEINMEESPKGRQERDRNDKKTGIQGWWWDVYWRFVK